MQFTKFKVIILGILVLTGCTLEGYREYQIQRIQNQNPNFDEITVQKLASGNIGIGMTREMVVASLGEPDSVSREGEMEILGYAYYTEGYSPKKILVYFIYIKDGKVIKTAGDRSKLRHLYWRK